MNKEEFILELEKKLKRLPKEEKESAITYYKEYFQDAGIENEEKVIQEIGKPSQVASQIMANYMVKEITSSKEEKNVKHSISTVWIVILSILASPIALPIGLTIITLILIMWVTSISFWIMGAGCVLGGIIYSILSILVFMQDTSTGMIVLGSGMLALGIGMLLTKAFSYLFIAYSSWVTKKMGKLLLRKEKKHEE